MKSKRYKPKHPSVARKTCQTKQAKREISRRAGESKAIKETIPSTTCKRTGAAKDAGRGHRKSSPSMPKHIDVPRAGAQAL